MARVEGFKAGTVASIPKPASAVVVPRLGMAAMRKIDLPAMPKLPPMPTVAAPMAPSSGNARDPTVVVIQQPIGQDVRDRAIAHTVTGGLGR